MNLQKNFREKILFVFVILLLNLTFLSVPEKASALYPAATEPTQISNAVTNLGKTAWDKAENYLQKALDSMEKIVAKKLISTITASTVNWINSGFNGNPAYVADINKFLTGPGGVADQTVGQWFQNQKNLAFLCDPFKVQVSLALQLNYGAAAERMGCTFTGISRNVNTAVDNSTITFDVNGNPITKNINKLNFSDEGGWDAWLRTTLQPQNNPIGAYQIAKARLDAAITDAQGNKIRDLSYGQGALTFKTCIDLYYDTNGAPNGQSKEYKPDSEPRPKIPGYAYDTHQTCVVKTPGSMVTEGLGKLTNSDIAQSEYSAALANGFDQIFVSLANLLIQKAQDKLKNGILGNNNSSNNAYNSALDTTMVNSLNNYNWQITDLNNQQSQVDWNPTTYPTSTPIVTQTLLTGGTTTWNYDPTSPITYNYDLTSTSTPVTTGNGYSGYGGYYNSLDGAKNNANNLINSLTKSELAYQNSYLIAQNVLTQAESIFATSSACNINYNRNDYVLRSLLIRTNVISNIDGIVSSDRTIASIPWNLQAIKAALDNSNGHIVILNKAKTDVATAGTITAVTDSMTPVNSTSFNTDPQATMVENIKTWLRGVGYIYNSILCPIDLTKVLQITSATSTPK